MVQVPHLPQPVKLWMNSEMNYIRNGFFYEQKQVSLEAAESLAPWLIQLRAVLFPCPKDFIVSGIGQILNATVTKDRSHEEKKAVIKLNSRRLVKQEFCYQSINRGFEDILDNYDFFPSPKQFTYHCGRLHHSIRSNVQLLEKLIIRGGGVPQLEGPR